MGLFGRLRSSSSAQAQARPTTTEEAPPLPLPPPHTASLYASSSRLSVNPSRPTESTSAQTPKSSKPFWKRKGKASSEKDVVGFSYESTSPVAVAGSGSRPGSFTVDRPQKPRAAVGSVLSPMNSRPVVPVAQSHSQSAVNGYGNGIGYEQDGYGYIRPAIERGQSAQSGQYRGSDRSDTYTNTRTNMSSPDTRQQYAQDQQPNQYPQQSQPTPKGILKPKAMLGKLDFEQDSSTDEDKVMGDQQLHPQRHSSYTTYDTNRQPVVQALGHGQRPQSTMMGMGMSQSDIRGREQSVPQPRMSMEEQMEHLVSPEKKQVWTPQTRRMSVSSDIEEPSSPTPRKNGLPAQDLTTPTPNANVPAPGMPRAASTDGHQSRPQSTRRPSSSRRASFIPLGNPFARSTTRVSSSNELEGQGGGVDDGSFQLRGFRHVSGASEADFAWTPPTVDSSTTSTNNTGTAATAPMVTSPTSVHAPMPSRPPSTQPIPSRPVSRATSLQSLDDHIAGSAKVSAAAFRKKIRRPSESASTHLDMEMDDDDDDVPLGMLRPGMRASSASALSLSSMKDGMRTPGSGYGMKANGSKSPAPAPAANGRSSTMSPGLPPTPTKVGARTLSPPGTPEVRRPPGPGRSRTTPLISPNEIHPMFPSPAGSPSSSPKLAPVNPKAAVEPEEVGYFGLTNGTATSTGKTGSPAPTAVASAVPVPSTSTVAATKTNGGGAVDDSPLFDFKSLDYPIDAFSTSPQAVKSVKLDHDHGPAVLAPPIAIDSRSSSDKPEKLSISTKTKETAVNANVIVNANTINIVNGMPTGQDSLDTDLAIRSMQLYADDNIADENEPPTPRVALHKQSHSTLFGDASSDNSTIRSPLSERLGNLVGPRPMSSKPSLPKLDTLRLEDGFGTITGNGNAGERIKSPGSDTTISPTVSTIRDHQSLPSSFARANVPHTTTTQGGRKTNKSDESDSESDSDSEGSASASESEGDIVPIKRQDGPPRSSFTNAPRPRVQPPSNTSTSSPSRAVVKPKQTRDSSPESGSDAESDDQDQPLARIKSKASRTKLATANSAQTQSTSGRPGSVFDQQRSNQNTYLTTPSVKSSTTPLPSTGAPPQFAIASQTRRASVPAVVSAPMHSGNGKGPGSPTKPIWSASPASSQSGLTGDSSAVQPVTPSENELSDTRPFKAPPAASQQQQWGESKRDSVSWAPEQRTRKSSNYSVATAPPEHGQRSDENAPPVPSLPNGMDPMDPLMRQRMKEVWQAQYMAAASRAFEDEWERQSTASASVAAPSIAPQQQYSPYSPPPQPQPQTQAQTQIQSPYGMGMPMGYGFPQHQQMPPMPTPHIPYMGMPHIAQGYYPTWNGMPPPPVPHGYPLLQQHQQAEPSMYAYGAGAQSVYGAEFGPSQAHLGMHQHPHQHHHQQQHQHQQHGNSNGQAMSPYARPTSMSPPHSYSTNNLHQGTYDNHTPNQHQSRPSLPTSKSTSYFSHAQQPQPPPQTRRRPSRDRDSDLDYTPPPSRGSTYSVPNSPRGSGANRRSQLGTSVISANDRSSSSNSMMAPPPPTSWRRSSAMPLLAFDEEESTTTPKKKRASVIVN